MFRILIQILKTALLLCLCLFVLAGARLAWVAGNQVPELRKDVRSEAGALVAEVGAARASVVAEVDVLGKALIGQVAGVRRDVTKTVLPVIDNRAAAIQSDAAAKIDAITGQVGTLNKTVGELAGAVTTTLKPIRETAQQVNDAALLEAERLTGLDVLAGELDLWRATTKQLRAALFVALRRAGWQGSLTEAGSLMAAHLLPAIRGAILSGWVASMARAEDDEEEAPKSGSKAKQTWVEAWATARYDLRLTDAEWLAMTPRQIAALRERQLEMMRYAEYQTGIVASSVENSSGRQREAVEPEHFMVHRFPRKRPEPQSVDELISIFSKFPKVKP